MPEKTVQTGRVLYAVLLEETDEELMLRIKHATAAGTETAEDAAEILFSRYFKRLVRLLQWSFSGPVAQAQAEDAAQTALGKMWAQRHRYDDQEGRFANWITTIAMNELRDSLRRAYHRHRANLDETAESFERIAEVGALAGGPSFGGVFEKPDDSHGFEQARRHLDEHIESARAWLDRHMPKRRQAAACAVILINLLDDPEKLDQVALTNGYQCTEDAIRSARKSLRTALGKTAALNDARLAMSRWLETLAKIGVRPVSPKFLNLIPGKELFSTDNANV